MTRAPGSYAGLTAKQAELLSYLRYQQEAGITPSFDEMKDAMALASKSGVSRLILALEERGYVVRKYGQHRGIVVNEHRDLKTIATPSLVQELTSRGFRFYGQQADVA